MVKINREGFTSLSGSVGASDDQAVLNVIFVHGLRGHPRNTWTGPSDTNTDTEAEPGGDAAGQRKGLKSLFGLRKAKAKPTETGAPKPPASSDVFWPEEYLVPDIPRARVWTYGYNADVIGGLFQSNNKNSVSQHGRDLAVRLERDMENEDPIVFLAHSLGGIIVKDALHRSKKCHNRTKFIVFLGTPHRGSGYANWGVIASNLARLGLQDSNKRVLETLEVNGEVLDNIHDEFKSIMSEHRIKVHSFQEAHGISGMKGLHGKVVDDFSSKLDLPSALETVESIDANHMQMARCRSKDDPRYRAISGVLKQFLRKEILAKPTALADPVESSCISKANEQQLLTCSRSLDAESIFRNTCSSFRQSLSEYDRGEFRRYENAESLISELQLLAESHPVHKSRLVAFVRKLHSFSRRLEPYFEIVNIYVQVKPDFAAAIWGSLRVLFKLLSNYVIFLDEVSDMFDRLATTFPVYGDFVSRLQAEAAKRGETYSSLAKAMAFLYRDILGFCHDICLMFAKKRQGFKAPTSFISRLALMPIQTQFTSVISSIKDHKELLELEITRASTEEALRFYDKMEEQILTADNVRAPRDDSGGDEQLKVQLEKLLHWINPPPFVDKLEQAQDRRSSGTSEWIVDDLTFQQWQSDVGDQQASLDKKTLIVQAKPGFGKTILCSRMIEHLGTFSLDMKDHAQHLVACVLYCFFDERKRASNNAYDALRAITAQLLSLHRSDTNIFLVAIAAKSESGTGQALASDKEIREILTTLLPMIGVTFIVLDGLDECTDQDELFTALHTIRRSLSKSQRPNRNGWLLCGRPSVVIPNWMSKGCYSLQLSHLANSDDISRFLLPEVEDLIESDFLPESTSAPDLVDTIVPRANGMFLWAKLLMAYLRSPALSFRDRQDAILHLNLLEGLDALYKAMLEPLSKQPEPSRSRIQNILRWVAFAFLPLPVDKLRTAVSVALDRRQSKEDEIPNFKKNLPIMTGSLIEISLSGKAEFVHLSARDYFQQHGGIISEKNSPIESFSVGSHIYICSVCLSYLFYTVYARPLSGSADVTSDKTLVDREYPLLDYASSYWAVHFAESANELSSLHSLPALPENINILSELVHSFVNCPRRITMWIEASWVFGATCVPDPRLRIRAKQKPPVTTSPSFERSSRVIELVHELSEDIEILNQKWSHVLKDQPNEIWNPSIPTFTKSRFWVTTTAARLIRLASSKEKLKNCMTIQSQISSSGLEMAVIRLIVPDDWEQMDLLLQLQYQSNRNNGSEWKSRFELWSLAPNLNHCISAFELVLPTQKMLSLISEEYVNQRAPQADTAQRLGSRQVGSKGSTWGSMNSAYSAPGSRTVSLPVAICNNVRRVAILDTILDATGQGTGAEGSLHPSTIRSNVLDLSKQAYTSKYKPIRADLDISRMLFDELTTMKFSPDGKYLAVIRESLITANKGGNSYGVQWLLQIFRDDNFRPTHGHEPNYIHIACTVFFAVPEVAIFSPSRGITFHPSLPRIAFPQVQGGLPGMFLWDFESLGLPLPVHQVPLFDPYFSDEGDYLCGTNAPLEFGFDEEVKHHLSVPTVTAVPEFRRLEDTYSANNAWIDRQLMEVVRGKGVSKVIATKLAERLKPQVQRANTLVFEKGKGGVVHVSQLQQLEKEGAVLMRTFGTDGEFKVQTLTRLPKSVKDCVDVCIVDRTVAGTEKGSIKLDPDKVYVVINKAHRKWYTALDLDDQTLPAVFEREKASVPTFVNTVNLTEGKPRGFEHYYGIQRISWDEEASHLPYPGTSTVRKSGMENEDT